MNLDWYDYGARFYDPSLGRWHVIDPAVENHLFQSPYVYSENNPVLFIDYNGEAPKWLQGAFIVWFGTHAEYDRIDAKTVSYDN